MEIYVIIKNDEEEYEDYTEWIEEIYSNKEKAEKRFLELIAKNKYKKDRKINMSKYYEECENIGAYRLEKHTLIE